jgi:D-beta-D-heptose 7-phosphate kinase/D-beta-D-heptose 1-phosphate adenosyltransferase
MLINTKKLQKILQNFKGAEILVLGDVILDEYIFGKVSRVSPEAPVPVVEELSRTHLPGGAAYVASHVNSLGGTAHLISVVGEDSSGDLILEQLKKTGISDLGIVKDSERPTVVKTRVIAQHQQIVRIDNEKKFHVNPLITKEILDKIKDCLSSVDVVIISDYGKGVVIPAIFNEVIKLGQKNKKPIAVDPKPTFCLQYKGVTIITPNQNEASQSVHIPITDEPSLIKAGNELLRRLKSESVLITRGEQGMSLFEKGKKPVHIPTFAREVFDVTGAGDTVIAVLSMALAAGAGILEASYLANYAAGIVVGKIGTAPLNLQEIKDALHKKKN